jgi:RimJ/RimL family protein N-acetyltransferase
MSDGLVIRRATEDDLDAFVDVLHAVAAEGRWIATEIPFDRAARAMALRNGMKNGDVLFMVEEHGRTIGSGGLHATGQRGVAMLGMALLQEARGQGRGQAMLQRMLEEAATHRIRRIELEVFPDNERAIALYRRVGFAELEVRREHLRRRDGSRRDVLAMALEVPVSQ